MSRVHPWLALAACLAVGAAISVWLGQDGNFDLQSYHLYNGGALLHGRFQRDLLAAGMQSYLNPVLDALYAGLALGPLRDWPRGLAAVMGLWSGVVLFLAVRIAQRLYPGQPLAAVAGTLLGVTGVALVSQIGTTFNEVQSAAVMLGGVLALLHADRPGRAAALAGALFGVAAGLKLTAMAFAPAALLAVCSLQPIRRAWRVALPFVAAWLAGFAVTDGWWALMLLERFGSPVFPLFNGLFRAPSYPPVSFVDDRFLPGSLLRAVIYPILWLTGPPNAVSEIPLRDPRGAVVLCLGAANLACAAWRRERLAPQARALLLFLGAGYAVWVATSGILRYAVVLEVAAGLVTPLLLARVVPRQLMALALTAVAAGVIGGTQYGSWGRVPYSRQALSGDVAWVQPNMLIIPLVGAQLAYLVPLMPYQNSIGVLGLDFAFFDARGWPLQDEALRLVRQHDGPIAVLTRFSPADPAFALRELGLDPHLTQCRPISSSFAVSGPDGPFVCMAAKQDPPVLPSPFWAEAARRYHVLFQERDAAMSVFGGTYLRSAGPAARGTHIVDWAELIWRGPHALPDPRTAAIDPGTLYVITADTARGLMARIDPAHDAIGTVDGITVLAPGWRDCPYCAVQPAPLVP